MVNCKKIEYKFPFSLFLYYYPKFKSEKEKLNIFEFIVFIITGILQGFRLLTKMTICKKKGTQ